MARSVRDYCASVGIAAHLECCEIVPKFAAQLQEQDFSLVASDFLTYRPAKRYDAIVMNPPYNVASDHLAYAAHFQHAWELLAPGGILLAIMPGGCMSVSRVEKRVQAMQAIVEEFGTWHELPKQSFKESGTGANTLVISVEKPS